MRRWASTKTNLRSVGSLIILVIIWEVVCKALKVPTYVLPAPTTIIRALVGNWALLLTHTKITLAIAIVGLLSAILVGLLLATAMNKNKSLKSVLYPLLVISQTVPIIALAPILMIWFGLGVLPKVLVVALVCFFPIAINVTDGLENVDPELIELLKIMGAGSRGVFVKVQLPSVLPYFFSGLKIAVTYSVMGAVIGEWLGGKSGLGIYMLRTMRSFSTENLFAAILMVVLLSMGLFLLTRLAEWLSMPWNRLGN